VAKAAEALTKTLTTLKMGTRVESTIRSCSPGETSALVIEEMGCKDGVDRSYYVTLSFLARGISQSKLPGLQKFGKAAAMVLLFEAGPSDLNSPPSYWVRVSFVAYANILA
jgi:hypothetical protein